MNMSSTFLTAMGREDRIPGRTPGQGRGAEKSAKPATVVNLPRPRQLTTELLDKATERVRKKIGPRVFDDGDWSRWDTPLGGGGWTSQNEADLALCGYAARELADLGITDPEELKEGARAVMERSVLSERPKWERNDYSNDTIAKAVASVTARLKPEGEATQGGREESATEGDKASEGPDLRRGDILAGEMFVDQHADRIKYCPERGCWYQWNGIYWQPSTQEEILEFAKETAGSFLDIAKQAMRIDPEKGGKFAKFAIRYHSLDGLTAMTKTARSDPRIRVRYAELDADPELLGVQNGIVNLRTGRFYPPDPTKLITRVAGVPYIEGATCPNWLQALDTTHEGDQEKIDFLQRAYGYTFTGYNHEEVMFCCYGFGENGKSVQENAIHHIAGDHVVTGDVSLLVHQKNGSSIPNALAATAGARQLSLNETQGGDELNTQALKMLAGREPVTARFLHQEFFSFKPSATPWYRTNHKPIVRDDSDGTWRRILLIHFRHKFTDEDKIPDIENRLEREGSGILNWIIAGAVDWFKHGLRVPECIRRDGQSYRSESDVLGQFLDEDVTQDPTHRVEQAVLWASWRSFCQQNGHHPGTKNSFSRRLKERGFSAWQSNNRRYYVGLNIRCSQGGLPPRA